MAKKTKADLQYELKEAEYELRNAKSRIATLEGSVKHFRELLPTARHRVSAMTYRESMVIETLAEFAPKRSIQKLAFNEFLVAIYVMGKEVGESRARTYTTYSGTDLS